MSYHLHPLAEYEKGVLNQRVQEDNNLDIFEMRVTQVSKQQNWSRENFWFSCIIKTLVKKHQFAMSTICD